MNGRERGRKLRDMIFADYAAKQTSRRPNSVRPGDIGKPCTRALWYAFHWADKLETFDGRKLRLFETGHSQEDRLLADLRRVGSEVISRDPENAAEQISIVTLSGHMKGFLDSVAGNAPFAMAEWVVGECKSHNDKSFKMLVSDGVEVSKPEHFAQMTMYMGQHQLAEALYCAVNKNDDDLYFEYVAFNETYYQRLLAKADIVAFSPSPPAKVNEKPEFYICKMCKAADVCHKGELPERNCRTCQECRAVKHQVLPIGEVPKPIWHCDLHDVNLTLDEQRAGCPDHRYRPGLVNGTLTSEIETPQGFGIQYAMKDGSTWVDVGPNEPREAPVFASAPPAAQPSIVQKLREKISG